MGTLFDEYTESYRQHIDFLKKKRAAYTPTPDLYFALRWRAQNEISPGMPGYAEKIEQLYEIDRELATAISKGNQILDHGISDSLMPIEENGISKITYQAFLGRTDLTSIGPEGTQSDIVISDSVNQICDSAFEHCTNLTTIVVPSQIASIGESAFMGCRRLVSVIFDGESQLVNLGDYAFKDCKNIVNISIPKGVSRIGYQCFSACDALASVEICKGVTEIASHAFSYCENLSYAKIPNSITQIGSFAFWGCRKLNKISYEGTTNQWYSIDFKSFWINDPMDIKVICTDGVISLTQMPDALKREKSSHY